MTLNPEKRDTIPDPLGVNHFRKSLEERLALQLDLLAQTIMRHQVYILKSVFTCDSNVTPVGDEVEGFGDAEFFSHKR